MKICDSMNISETMFHHDACFMYIEYCMWLHLQMDYSIMAYHIP